VAPSALRIMPRGRGGFSTALCVYPTGGVPLWKGSNRVLANGRSLAKTPGNAAKMADVQLSPGAPRPGGSSISMRCSGCRSRRRGSASQLEVAGSKPVRRS
jgi:hypothetical protein